MTVIAFVNPPGNLKIRYGKYSGAGSTLPSLGLASLAAVCRKNGFEPCIIEAASGSMTGEGVVDHLITMGARYAGITAMTSDITSAGALASLIKTRDATIQVLIGGAHVTALPEATMRLFPGFDVAFIGEAETTIVDYLKAMSAGTGLEHVAGIVYRVGDTLQTTLPRPFIGELDTLPLPAWDLIPGFPDRFVPAAIRCKHLPASHIVTSRGCPMTCTFCDRSVFGNRYRLFSVEYIWEMIQTLTKKFGVKDILFEDDSFTLHKKRVIALCELICAKKARFSWSCLGRVDTIDAELLTVMKKAGCWQIGFGIESGNADVLQNVEKKINLQKIRDTLALTRAAGIRTKGFFILGLPGETKETIQETIRFATSIALDDISVSFATPFPGTVFYDQVQSEGTCTPDLQKMNLLNVVFVPKGLSKQELEEWHATFVRRFYLRPRIFIDYFIRSVGDVKVFLRLARAVFVVSGMAFKKAGRS